MAYSAKDALNTFLGYLGLEEKNISFIENTNNRGILLSLENEEDCVIFVYPISHKKDDSKNFFDTRDSGARERGVAWKYSLENNLKYFCVAVHDGVERYKNYIFSLESNENIVAEVSGTIDGRREGPGTQVVIPNDFAPLKDIERIRTRNNFFITAVRKDKFFDYVKIFDNRPYTHEYDLSILEQNNDKESSEKLNILEEEYKNYLINVKKYSAGTAYIYARSLSENTITLLGVDELHFNFESYIGVSQFKEIALNIRSSSNYSKVNEGTNRALNAAITTYTDFLEWRKTTERLPHQRIFFGAPGTGKSYQLNKEAKEYFGNNYERVTFHPNYMYGNFVGAYKPFPKVLRGKDGEILADEFGNVKENITYQYVEGVFMRSLVKALKNPSTNYLVIVEEINRANVASVFGDVFQLLDRAGNGKSEYKIATSKELQEYLTKENNKEEFDDSIKAELGEDFSSLFLPSNFYIWATMNSADQGVMPMDTAFRRRWDFTYLGIDDAVDESFDNYKIKISNNEIAKWDDFRRAVNQKLSSCRIPEDKLIGPYFISKSVLESNNVDELTSVVRDKVLMYLYEDAAKAHRSSVFAEGKYDTYSMVCSNFDLNVRSLFKGDFDFVREQIEIKEDDDNMIEVSKESDSEE